MNINKDEWRNTQAKEATNGTKFKPGAYVCRIVSAVDFSQKGYLELKFDFDEGFYAGLITKKTNGNLFQWWNMMTKCSWYGNGNNARFKGDITSIERSNPGYSFEEHNFDENTLVGKRVVVVLREEEYVKQDGSVGLSLKIDSLRSIEAYREGQIETPKRLTIADKLAMQKEKEANMNKGTPKYEPNPLPNNTPNFTDPFANIEIDDDSLPF